MLSVEFGMAPTARLTVGHPDFTWERFATPLPGTGVQAAGDRKRSIHTGMTYQSPAREGLWSVHEGCARDLAVPSPCQTDPFFGGRRSWVGSLAGFPSPGSTATFLSGLPRDPACFRTAFPRCRRLDSQGSAFGQGPLASISGFGHLPDGSLISLRSSNRIFRLQPWNDLDGKVCPT